MPDQISARLRKETLSRTPSVSLQKQAASKLLIVEDTRNLRSALTKKEQEACNRATD